MRGSRKPSGDATPRSGRRQRRAHLGLIHATQAPEAPVEGEDWSEIDKAIDQAEKDAKQLGPPYRATVLEDKALVLASFLDVEVGNIGGREKWLAKFTITGCATNPDARGLVILRSYNPPRPGWLSPQHALTLDFVAVTSLPPEPIPKLSPRAILGSFLKDVEVEARTHLVHERMDRIERKWKETPAAAHYSVIDRILRRTAGCPRINRRRGRP